METLFTFLWQWLIGLSVLGYLGVGLGIFVLVLAVSTFLWPDDMDKMVFRPSDSDLGTMFFLGAVCLAGWPVIVALLFFLCVLWLATRGTVLGTLLVCEWVRSWSKTQDTEVEDEKEDFTLEFNEKTGQLQKQKKEK